MANKIILKKSSVATKVPLAADLEVGEIAVNLVDQKLYTKNAGGTVILVGSGLGGSGDVQGPSSATDNALARFDATTGKIIQNGVITQNDDGSLANVNALTFDTTPTNLPTAAGSMYWDEGNKTPTIVIDTDVALQLGQEMLALVYNGTGSTITNGSVVAVSGAQGQRPRVVLADADSEALSAPTLGIATEDIANGAEGFVTTFGFVRGINTSAFTAGAPIYLSQTAGQFTATRPAAPAHTVALGWVIKVNASSGEVFVNINNGWELDELHNVLITSPISGNTLIYDASVGVWKNANITAGTGVSVTNGAGSITIANTGVTSAVAGTGISVSAGTGAVTVTNTAPDQVVSLTGAGATSVTGTYPNFTITSTNTTYSLATSTVAGLIELASNTVQSTAANAVTSTASRTYGLQVNAGGQGVINVPWTDTTYVPATSTVAGLIELGSDTVQSTAANAVTSTASRTYALQVNASGQGVINVPWTDTNSGGTVTSITAGTGLSGGTITTSGTIALANTAVTAGSYTYASITVDAQGRLTAASSGSAPQAFPSGTAMLFAQTAAPTGWTKSTTHNDKALRVVSGTAGSGGTVAFSTAFVSQAVNGSVSTTTTNTTATGTIGTAVGYTTATGTNSGTAITTAQLPAHNHGINDPGHSHSLNDPGHAHGYNDWGNTPGPYQVPLAGGFWYNNDNRGTAGSGTGQSINGAGTGISTQNAGSGATHTHTFTGDSHNHSAVSTFTGVGHNHAASSTFTGTAINLAVQYVDVIIATKD